eukprot:TRINITY_DN25975_c0_g1_i1.p1 TRINITY_DN25975_c0_g1~~TRINITY_DN25975_c0_g1_i1.p1  ORF type:complete len:527 (+),score=57.93 TRINITY_DN25975_c0_g1_i1:41-1621(+)
MISFRQKEYDRQTWSPLRVILDDFFNSTLGEYMPALIIIPNAVLLILEANAKAHCSLLEANGDTCEQGFIDAYAVAGYVFLGIYTLEAIVRSFTYRLNILEDAWALLDIVIVVFGYADFIISMQGDVMLPGVSVLRIFRMVRLLRTVKLVRAVPMLHSYIRGFLCAMNAMFWGFVIITILLTVWAIFAVEIIHPNSLLVHEEDSWCREAFSSVYLAMILFFQTLVAGDSWGQCAIPIVRYDLTSMFIFLGAFVTVQLGFTNLILAIIVEASADSRESSREQILKERQKARVDAELKLGDICREIDKDNDGVISLEELQRGFSDHSELKTTLQLLDVETEDLPVLFDIMDADHSGFLHFQEIINYIHKADTCDIKRQVVLVKLQLDKVLHVVEHRLMAYSNELSRFLREEAKAHFAPSGNYHTQYIDDACSHSISNSDTRDVRLSERCPDRRYDANQEKLNPPENDCSAQNREHASAVQPISLSNDVSQCTPGDVSFWKRRGPCSFGDLPTRPRQPAPDHGDVGGVP